MQQRAANVVDQLYIIMHISEYTVPWVASDMVLVMHFACIHM
jgi:hypothetical protein